MAIYSYLFHTLLLFSSLCNSSMVFGYNTDSHRLVRVRPLPLPAETCSSQEYKKPGLKIIHRHGPCSPFDGQRATPIQILQQDQARVNWLQSRLTRDSSRVDVQDTTLPVQPGAGDYIVTVGFGTPKRDMTLAFDTGSDLTWIQCQPCADGSGCHQQQDPIFNPTESSSYLNLSCNSNECAQLNLTIITRCSSSSACIYFSGYGDGSESIGFFARDTLSLTQSDVFPNFLFGCGQLNEGSFGSEAGLLGLGRDPVSLVSQTAIKFGGVFSYCLPSMRSSHGYLTFGAHTIPSGIKFTPLVTHPNNTSFYFINMIGISIGRQALPIPASTFASPGTIIDSGTTLTYLPPLAYAMLRSAFRQAMSNYTLVGTPDSSSKTCYELGGTEDVVVPAIVLHFEGDVNVDADFYGIIQQVSETVGCLAFADNGGFGNYTIIGNRQQVKLDVVYDVAGGRVGFGPGNCQ